MVQTQPSSACRVQEEGPAAHPAAACRLAVPRAAPRAAPHAALHAAARRPAAKLSACRAMGNAVDPKPRPAVQGRPFEAKLARSLARSLPSCRSHHPPLPLLLPILLLIPSCWGSPFLWHSLPCCCSRHGERGGGAAPETFQSLHWPTRKGLWSPFAYLLLMLFQVWRQGDQPPPMEMPSAGIACHCCSQAGCPPPRPPPLSSSSLVSPSEGLSPTTTIQAQLCIPRQDCYQSQGLQHLESTLPPATCSWVTSCLPLCSAQMPRAFSSSFHAF